MKRINQRGFVIYTVFYSLFVFLTSLLTSSLYAVEPPVYPILRIETGMHTAPIIRIGVDADSRFVVTGSHDKSVRVWEYIQEGLKKIYDRP